MKKKTVISVLVVFGLLVIALFAFAQTAFACDYGCTPGYWKQPQHFDSWTGYQPNNMIGDYFPEALNYVDNVTLLDALDFGGGPDLEGATKILLRAATATMLNSAYDAANGGNWHYWPWEISPDLIQWRVNAAIATGDRGTILHWAEFFDSVNNLGCPLD